MPLIAAGRTALGTSGKAGFTHVAAYTDLAGTEVAGGSYARQAVTQTAMGTPAAGQFSNTAQLIIPIPVGTTVVATGYCDALTAGNRLSVDPYGSAGQVVYGAATVDAATDLFLSKGHGVTTDDRVYFSAIKGEAIPTGVVITTLYFVLAAGLTADAFAVSATSGGAALNVTVSGECWFWKTVPNVFASAGQLTIAANALVVDLNAA